MAFAATDRWMEEAARGAIFQSHREQRGAGLALTLLLHAVGVGLLLGSRPDVSMPVDVSRAVLTIDMVALNGVAEDRADEGAAGAPTPAPSNTAPAEEGETSETAAPPEWSLARIPALADPAASIARPSAPEPRLPVSAVGSGMTGAGPAAYGRGTPGFDPYAGAAPMRWQPATPRPALETMDNDAVVLATLRQRLRDAFPRLQAIQIEIMFESGRVRHVAIASPRLSRAARQRIIEIVRGAGLAGNGSDRRQLNLSLA